VFAALFGCITAIAGFVAFCITDLYLPAGQLVEQNNKTIRAIHCSAETCDISELANDPDFDGSEYVIDRSTHFFLNYLPPQGLRSALNYADPSFVIRFHEPTTLLSPAEEKWRLLSTEEQIANHKVAILTGYAEHVSWRMDGRVDLADIDEQLKGEIQRIATSIRFEDSRVEIPLKVIAKLPMDGYAVVDVESSEILTGGLWLPLLLSPDVHYPREGTSFTRSGRKVYMLETTSNDRLTAVSTFAIGDLPSLSALFAILFLIGGLAGHVVATTVLRRYLAFSKAAATGIDDALRKGEGLTVEFKRSIAYEVQSSVNQVLETIAAFANTADGTLFIGVEDDAKVKGIDATSAKAKDSISHRLYQIVRDRISPVPHISIDFVEHLDKTVCRVFVQRGDRPLYFLDGTIFVRNGSSDIKARPELVERILEEFAY
jgi:hypothetical protein